MPNKFPEHITALSKTKQHSDSRLLFLFLKQMYHSNVKSTYSRILLIKDLTFTFLLWDPCMCYLTCKFVNHLTILNPLYEWASFRSFYIVQNDYNHCNRRLWGEISYWYISVDTLSVVLHPFENLFLNLSRGVRVRTLCLSRGLYGCGPSDETIGPQTHGPCVTAPVSAGQKPRFRSLLLTMVTSPQEWNRFERGVKIKFNPYFKFLNITRLTFRVQNQDTRKSWINLHTLIPKIWHITIFSLDMRLEGISTFQQSKNVMHFKSGPVSVIVWRFCLHYFFF